jgi:glycosyltransferase involved in cell wall biosynthesis
MWEIVMSNVIESITSCKEITIIHPYSQSEIKIPTFGGTRLIAEQIGYLEELGSKVRVISLGEIGSLTSFLYRLQANLRSRAMAKARNPHEKYDSHSEKSRWWLNLVQVLINDYSAKLDILYRHYIENIIASIDNGSILIYHYPYGARYFASAARKKDMQFILYQHNIEWQFFDERLSDGWIRRMLIPKARKIELDSLGSADIVAFASDKDRSALATENGCEKMISWIPIRKRPEKVTITEVPASMRDKIKGKLVVGFVGTNFGPNIAAAENLMELARETSGSLVFLVMGSVSRAFDDRNDIPQNMHFTGHVQDLDAYLSLCDLFINPKTTSDTGVETKMFDYLRFDKPIISTAIGARGFEGIAHVSIMPTALMAKRMLQIRTRGGEVESE